MPDTTLANIERWAAGLSVPAYAIDDQTAIKAVDATVEVVDERDTGSCSPRARKQANRRCDGHQPPHPRRHAPHGLGGADRSNARMWGSSTLSAS